MDFEHMNNNKVTFCGEIVESPKFSHELYGEGFYEGLIKIKRLSETYDIIPITISERLMNKHNFEVGSVIAGVGQFRSYNKIENEKSRLMLTIFIRELIETNLVQNPNEIVLTGHICKEPIFRTTPFKREICDVLLAVNRNYNKSDYLPCICWGRNARYCKDLQIGDKITIHGRIQSREYQKRIDENNVETKTAYEISINRIINENNNSENLFNAEKFELKKDMWA